MVTRAEGRTHTLTLRDVKMTEAGEVKLTAKDFLTQAQLIVNGRCQLLNKNSIALICGLLDDVLWNEMLVL